MGAKEPQPIPIRPKSGQASSGEVERNGYNGPVSEQRGYNGPASSNTVIGPIPSPPPPPPKK